MSAIIFKVPLTKEEQSSYESEFKALDKDQLGIVTGETLKSYFGRSGLPSQQLSKVWALVDTEMQGFLNLKQFGAAMRSIAHLQANPQQPITKELYQNPPPILPTFMAVELTHTGYSTGNGNRIPPISAHDYAKYSQLFDKSSEDRQTVSGLKAKEVFMKAKLPTITLGSLWALCDRNNSGSLDKIEFIVAMHLIQLTLNKHPSVTNLPNKLPAYVWDQTTGMVTTPLSNDSTGMSSSSGPRPLLGRVPSSFMNVSSDWGLTHAKKQQFDNIFDSLDKNKAGSLGADVLVPFFLTSKLSQDTLATIWDLADIHNNPVFTKTEFAIAMFLIQKKNAGIELPDVVPDQLLHSPALGLVVPSSVQHLSQQTTPTKGFQPSIPSRDTKPHFDQLQLQGGAGSALTDLLGLKSSFAASGGRNVQPVSNNNTGSSVHAGGNYRIPPSVTGSLSLDGYNTTSNTNTVSQEIEQQNTQQSFVDSSHTGSFIQPSSQAVNRRSTFVSNLPNVPDFGSVGIPMQHSGATRSTHIDPEISKQLSQATTDLANLSNQVSSLSTQTTKLHEKKSFAERELAQVSALKASIESKLSSLRASYEQETLQTEQVEKMLLQSKRDTESLKQQLSTLEADYSRVQNNLTQLQQQLQESEQENSQLKEQIGNYNRLTASLQKELIEKQQSVKQEKSMVDVNAKQAELSQISVANLQAEIKGLEEHLAVFISKRKELDEYQVNIEKQHTQLESRHQSFISRSKDLENKYHDIADREKELKERMKQVVEQEGVYRDQVSRLEEIFKDLNRQREIFEKADQELQQRRIEYAQKVQDLSDKEMKLAMGGLSKDISSSNSHGQDVDPVSKYVDETLTNSKLSTNVEKGEAELQTEGPSNLPHDEEGKQDSVFDKDFPTSPSQTEVDDEDHPATAETVAQALDESDMNVYRIPRSESVTSSTANNAPQSLRDEAVSDTQDPVLEEETEHSTFTKISSIDEEGSEVTRDAIRSIPGGWGDVGLVDDYNNHTTTTSSPVMGVAENTSVEVSSESISDGAATNKVGMDADSGIFEDAYQSTRELPSSTHSGSGMSFGTEIPSRTADSERQQTATRQEGLPRSPEAIVHSGAVIGSAPNESPLPAPGKITDDAITAESNGKSVHGSLTKDSSGNSEVSSPSNDDPVSEAAFIAHVNTDFLGALPENHSHTHKAAPITAEAVAEASKSNAMLPADKNSHTEKVDVLAPLSTVAEHEPLDGTGTELPMQFNFEQQFPVLPSSEKTTAKGNEMVETHDSHSMQESHLLVTPANAGNVVNPTEAVKSSPHTSRVSTSAEFDDADFAGLEQASPEDESGSFVDGIHISEDFDSVGHTDLEDELHESGFTGSNGVPFGGMVTGTSNQISTQGVSEVNDEWNEIFSGFGNSASAMKQPTPPTTLDPPSSQFVTPAGKSPIDRKVATTPKSIAVEELSSMGFSQQVALKALEKCKWDLEAATNFLLDNS